MSAAQSQAMAEPRTWRIELPPATPIIPTNHRLHYHARNRLNVQLHETAGWAALLHRLPLLELADVRLEYAPPPRLRKDRHPLASDRIDDSDGLSLTLKALTDGLAKAGIFASDTRKHVRDSTCSLLTQTHPMGQLYLTITEVTDA